jgi:hypothetical protein
VKTIGLTFPPSLGANGAAKVRRAATVSALADDAGMRDFQLINASAKMKATVAKGDMVAIWACQSKRMK